MLIELFVLHTLSKLLFYSTQNLWNSKITLKYVNVTILYIYFNVFFYCNQVFKTMNMRQYLNSQTKEKRHEIWDSENKSYSVHTCCWLKLSYTVFVFLSSSVTSWFTICFGWYERLIVSRDRDRHGGLPETAGLFTLRDMEPVILLCLLSFKAGSGGGSGQLRQLKTRTISFN